MNKLYSANNIITRSIEKIEVASENMIDKLGLKEGDICPLCNAEIIKILGITTCKFCCSDIYDFLESQADEKIEITADDLEYEEGDIISSSVLCNDSYVVFDAINKTEDHCWLNWYAMKRDC